MIYELANQAATEFFAAQIASIVRPGDCLCLEGELGGGKSTFARALIRWLRSKPDMDVPSPTFTLVQDYPHTILPCQHIDLYRLNSQDDVEQLDLFDDPDQFLLIEWPNRAGSLLPHDRLQLAFTIPDPTNTNRRQITITPHGANWPKRLARLQERKAFLRAHGWGETPWLKRFGDASPRTHIRLGSLPKDTLMLFDTEANPDQPIDEDKLHWRKNFGQPDHRDIRAFIKAHEILDNSPFSISKIKASDAKKGFVLLEDLGSASITNNTIPSPQYYEQATLALAELHRQYKAPAHEPCHPELFIMTKTKLMGWITPALERLQLGSEINHQIREQIKQAVQTIDQAPFSLMHRDFHSPNLIVCADRQDKPIGLVDIQDLCWGPPTYDLASLLFDARATLSEDLQTSLLASYLNARTDLTDSLKQQSKSHMFAMALIGCLRLKGHLRQLADGGQPWYLEHMKRNTLYLKRLQSHYPWLNDIL